MASDTRPEDGLGEAAPLVSGKLIDQLVQCERQSPVIAVPPAGVRVLAPQLAQEYVYVRCLGHREGLSDEQPRVIVGAAGETP